MHPLSRLQSRLSTPIDEELHMTPHAICAAAVLLVGTATGVARADEFDGELTAWKKKAVLTCAMIRDPKASDAPVVARNLDELGSALEVLARRYRAAPPAAYGKDPLWASYFDDLTDNLTVVKYFTGRRQYRVASKNCNVFCQTILRMHKNNGTPVLSDMLFSLNMQLRLITDMANAGNADGARDNAEVVKEILEHAAGAAKGSEDAKLQALFAPVEKATQAWLEAIEAGDARAAKVAYGSFVPEYQKIYVASM
jgi:hypothetical protein